MPIVAILVAAPLVALLADAPSADPAGAADARVVPAKVAAEVPDEPRVWTADDLAHLPAGNVSVIGAEVDPVTPPAAPVPTTLAPATAGEEDWRAAALRLDAATAATEDRLAALEELDSQWTSLVLGTGQYQAAAASELSDIRRETAALQAELRQLRGEKELLLDAARRQRIPPGWLR